MKYKFCSICMNATKYDVTFVTKGVLIPNPPLGPCGYSIGTVYDMLLLTCKLRNNIRYSLLVRYDFTCTHERNAGGEGSFTLEHIA